MKSKRDCSTGGARDERFWQLLALADEGNEEAQGDLWREYAFAYGVDPIPERRGAQ